MNCDETIQAFRRGALEIDCKRMIVTQRKEGGTRFEGPGYINQSADGRLAFKIYAVKRENTHPLAHLEAHVTLATGKIPDDEVYYDLLAIAHDGTTWTADRLSPSPN
jgi:hypothetical protein